jgi:hypothetical protein
MENKKGIALNQAFGAVLVLVLIGVLVIIGLFIFVSLNTSFINLDTVSVTEEDLTAVDDTPQFVAQSPTNNGTLCNYGTFAVTAAANTTDGGAIAAGNYTTTNTGSIAVSADVDANLNGTDWSVNYTANWGGASCVAGNAMITEFGAYPVLVGLVGTIIFLGLVIGVLVSAFVFGGRKSGF